MASAKTYDQIAWTSLGTGAATITLSSIPSTYTDLRLVLTLPGIASSTYIRYRINSDSATNYSFRYLAGDGAAASSGSGQSQTFQYLISNAPTATSSMSTVDFFQYSNTAVYKTALMSMANDQNGTGVVHNQVQLWRSTAAISSILLYTASGGNFSAGTTVALYGIKAA
jgi:hypothetical protein